MVKTSGTPSLPLICKIHSILPGVNCPHSRHSSVFSTTPPPKCYKINPSYHGLTNSSLEFRGDGLSNKTLILDIEDSNLASISIERLLLLNHAQSILLLEKIIKNFLQSNNKDIDEVVIDWQ